MKPWSCENCIFWHKVTDWGECRRHSPTRLQLAEFSKANTTTFPIVGPEGWCGDFQEKIFYGEQTRAD